MFITSPLSQCIATKNPNRKLPVFTPPQSLPVPSLNTLRQDTLNLRFEGRKPISEDEKQVDNAFKRKMRNESFQRPGVEILDEMGIPHGAQRKRLRNWAGVQKNSESVKTIQRAHNEKARAVVAWVEKNAMDLAIAISKKSVSPSEKLAYFRKHREQLSAHVLAKMPDDIKKTLFNTSFTTTAPSETTNEALQEAGITSDLLKQATGIFVSNRAQAINSKKGTVSPSWLPQPYDKGWGLNHSFLVKLGEAIHTKATQTEKNRKEAHAIDKDFQRCLALRPSSPAADVGLDLNTFDASVEFSAANQTKSHLTGKASSSGTSHAWVHQAEAGSASDHHRRAGTITPPVDGEHDGFSKTEYYYRHTDNQTYPVTDFRSPDGIRTAAYFDPYQSKFIWLEESQRKPNAYYQHE